MEGVRSTMSLRGFFESVLEIGHALLPTDAVSEPNSLSELRDYFREFEVGYRTNLPGSPPALDEKALQWAAWKFYRACVFSIHKEVEPATIAKEFGHGPVNTPSTAYSVDIFFRFLPDLLKIASAAGDDDPLVFALRNLCVAWPLSSVGSEIEVTQVDVIVEDPCLRAIYVDRIIESADYGRLSDPRVRSSVAAALGIHHSLAPKLAQRIQELNQRKQTA